MEDGFSGLIIQTNMFYDKHQYYSLKCPMAQSLDVDLLKTFIAISDGGSFTRAATEVHRTQSAVSMQMKRLEEAIGRPLFVREGRQSRLTADGEHLLDFARRIVKLNDEAVMTFTAPELSGLVRMGTPDDYADRFLPEILARFARTHPLIQVQVDCRPSGELMQRVGENALDLALVSCGSGVTAGEIIRREPLVWVTSVRHCTHEDDPVPLALPQPGCAWRGTALEALDGAGRDYRLAFVSPNSTAISAAVMAGLAVSAFPESTLRPGMRVLGEADGYPLLGTFDIGLLRSSEDLSSAAHALAAHIIDSLGNLGAESEPARFDFAPAAE
jgi:DNA-binding transcriptional LysR family regulator